MHIFRTWSEVPAPLKGGVIALGNFDGLHKGHQAVIGEMVRTARAAERVQEKWEPVFRPDTRPNNQGVAAAVMTFAPHPRQFFRPEQEPFLLSPFRLKARLIEALGVDYLYVQTFDREFSQRSAENFVAEVLVGGLGVSHIVVGFDYVFGHQRKGNVALLKELAGRYGFGVTAVGETVAADGVRYSSTNIRNLLKDGRPEDAARLLGRYWEIEGRVEQGDKRGRLLGFPTANLPYKDYLHPRQGVYAVRAGIDQGAATVWHDGVANFGSRPTVDKTDILLEVHLLGFDADLYGRHLRVALIDYLRPVQKFDGLPALTAQIAKDAEKAKDALTRLPPAPLAAPYVAAK